MDIDMAEQRILDAAGRLLATRVAGRAHVAELDAIAAREAARAKELRRRRVALTFLAVAAVMSTYLMFD